MFYRKMLSRTETWYWAARQFVNPEGSQSHLQHCRLCSLRLAAAAAAAAARVRNCER
jgi:hypothetical protein